MLKKRQGAPAPAVAASPIAATNSTPTLSTFTTNTSESLPLSDASTNAKTWDGSAVNANLPGIHAHSGSYEGTHFTDGTLGTVGSEPIPGVSYVPTGTANPSSTYIGIGDPLYPWNPIQITPVPALPASYTFVNTPQNWGVQEKTDPEKGGPQYWVVNPLTISYVENVGAKIIARCNTENDAQMICKLLNEQYEGTQEPVSDGVNGGWHVREGLYQHPRGYWAVSPEGFASSRIDGPNEHRWVAHGISKGAAEHIAEILNGEAHAKFCTCKTEGDSGCECYPHQPGCKGWAHKCPEGAADPAKGKQNPCDCKPSEFCDCCAPEPAKQEPRRLTANLAKEYIQSLQGRALTIIDAAIPGESQNKALKDLFKREFRKSIGIVMEYAYQGINNGPASAEWSEEG